MTEKQSRHTEFLQLDASATLYFQNLYMWTLFTKNSSHCIRVAAILVYNKEQTFFVLIIKSARTIKLLLFFNFLEIFQFLVIFLHFWFDTTTLTIF